MADHITSAKEVVRHILFRLGGVKALRLAKRLRGLPAQHLAEGGLRRRFSIIHSDRVWSAEGSVSGPGSDGRATTELQLELGRILSELAPARVVDIGCGDFGWMSGVIGDWPYIGVDIVADLIGELNAQYAGDRRRFLCADATKDDLPDGDVAICREVLFHLSFADAKALLGNLLRGEFHHLVATSDTSTWFNSDIPSGDYRPVNLALTPFRFPDPIMVIRDDAVLHGRILGVWRVSDLRRLGDGR